ncbi:helix-turn-helix domain-containing protein [Streptomyces albidoflavus]
MRRGGGRARRLRTGATPESPGAAREALAQNVRRHRLARGWSLRELGAATGISKGLLSQIERAEANPTLEILTRLAHVLATTCTDLLRRPLLRPEIVRAAELAEEPGETSVDLLFAQGESWAGRSSTAPASTRTPRGRSPRTAPTRWST